MNASYVANVVGFGGTNAAFSELTHALPVDKVNHVSQAVFPTAASHSEGPFVRYREPQGE